MTKLFALIIILFLSSFTFGQDLLDKDYDPNDNLIIIKTISESKKSFVIQLGKSDGILPGQVSLFSTKNVTILARAITVNRDYSQWTITEEDALIPFKRNQFVTLSKSVERIWTEIPIVQMIEKRNKIKSSLLRQSGLTFVTLKSNFIQGLKESTSEVEDEQATRSGVQIEGIYSKSFWPQIELGLGLRYDSETLKKETADLAISTVRTFVLFDVLYHFSHRNDATTSYYAGLSLGFGQSSTAVNEQTKTGLAYILPSVRLGAEIDFIKETDLLFEASLESLSAKEEFSDGEAQQTNILAAKLSVGLKF
ncbi:hypothetical protein HBN50_08155 [Halobacteriovorax sp. GB3]|uniref:hypothetical protein n=1 Tax=Halobacteriovorax sp. GB3 TaxID=2719615 RepID=UPI00235F41E1|nr:hypothetical protein [Halobacteriovorax sp. GB3]MDD0853065.1 hypothetical protein [Halobacteriovorax sp. GB3]